MKKKHDGRTWSEEEDLIIRALLPGDMDEAIQMLPDRSPRECYLRAEELGIHYQQGLDTPWSRVEDEILEREDSFRDILRELPYRTKASCAARLAVFNLYKPDMNLKRWTKEEDDILIEAAENAKPMEYVYRNLPHRTAPSCYQRAATLHLKFEKQGPDVPWTTEEDDALREFIPLGISAVLKKLPNRTRAACAIRVHELNLGISPQSSNGRWSQQEDDILREAISQPYEEGKDLLPGRSRIACASRARKFGLSKQMHRSWTEIEGSSRSGIKISRDPWTDAEIKLLRMKYPREDTAKLAASMKRSQTSVIKKARELGIERVNKRIWTEKELHCLAENYEEMGSGVYKLIPGRSRNACSMKAKELNLSKRSANSPVAWTEEEDEILSSITEENIDKIASLIPAHTKMAVITRAKQRGYLSKKTYQTSTAWTQEELNILRKKFKKLGPVETAKLLPHKSPLVVYHKAQALGLAK